MINREELTQFIDKLRPFSRIIIQAHDFPDHDAVSSAFAFAELLSHFNIETQLVYNGEIDRISLSNMIDWLDIPIQHCSQVRLFPDDKIITIDGCIGEKNVTDLPGEEIAVIDHHTVCPTKKLWFQDIRKHYGATATIIFEYFQLFDIELSQRAASALLIGLNIDTANMTRGFCQADLKSFIGLNVRADLPLVNKISRNSLVQYELDNFSDAFKQVTVINGVATVLLDKECPKNMLGIIGDFLLAVNEFEVVIVGVKQNGGLQLSFRSECPKVDVGELARVVLSNSRRGFGGGHRHMAGGLILPEYVGVFAQKGKIFNPFIQQINLWRSQES